MVRIEKKIWPKNFEAVLSGEKKHEPRLQDFEIAVGDTLVLKEWDPKTGEYTGREVEKKVTGVLKLSPKEIYKYWSHEEIEDRGLQIISFE